MPLSATADQVLTHWDDLEFVEVLGTRNCIVNIEGKDGPSDAIVLAVGYDPGVRLPAHRHGSGHFEVILEGSLRVGDEWEHAGTVRVVPANFTYGPLIAGPEGCKSLEFFPDAGAFLFEVADPQEMATLLGSHSPEEIEAKLTELFGGPPPFSLTGG